MAMRKRTKEIYIILSIIVLAGGASAGVVKTWENEKRNQMISDHNEKLESLRRDAGIIERRLGKDGEFLDVRDLWVSENYVIGHLTDSEYFAEDNFYAASGNSEGSPWIYKETTDQELLASQIREHFASESADNSAPFQIHLWRGKLVHEVTASDIFVSLFPSIVVQRMSPQYSGVSHQYRRSRRH